MDKYSYASLGLIFCSIIIIILGIIYVHTYPGKIAKQRNHPQVKAIEVTSLLGLIVFPLWMFALIWAYSDAVLGIIPVRKPTEGAGSADGQGSTTAATRADDGIAAPEPQ